MTLDRAVHMSERYAGAAHAEEWRAEADRIHREVMDRGWCERLRSFRQRYESDDALDASSLLISIFDFLPADDPHVLATIDRTVECLSINHFVYRFDPCKTPGLGDRPLGEFEGAFLPATFWLATAFAKSGRLAEAKRILQAAEAIAGPLGLFAEGVDPRNRTYLGNSPLLFSHVEYVRARLELERGEAGKNGDVTT